MILTWNSLAHNESMPNGSQMNPIMDDFIRLTLKKLFQLACVIATSMWVCYAHCVINSHMEHHRSTLLHNNNNNHWKIEIRIEMILNKSD